MEVEVLTFGCRINSYESELIKEMIATSPWAVMSKEKFFIINSCAVTAEAVRQCRQAIRKIKKENPTCFIAVTGCAAQVNPVDFIKMPEVDKVIGNFDKLNINNFFSDDKVKVSDAACFTGDVFNSPVINDFDGRAKAYIQIQQGCDNKCTYCIVPKARGKSRSCSFARIADEANKLVKAGFQELTLTGIDIASWQGDKGETVSYLIKMLLDKVKGLQRLRLSSFDPAKVDDELIQTFATQPKLMPHLHLSLQAGDNTVLARMGRRHSVDDVAALCRKLRQARAGMVFGADIITGFPTETDEMFANTVQLIKDCNIILLHIFPYSVRPDTPAARMPLVPVPVRKQRAKILRKAGESLRDAYLSSMIGKTVQVLIEKPCFGLCENYLPITVESSALSGSVIKVRVVDGNNGLLQGVEIK